MQGTSISGSARGMVEKVEVGEAGDSSDTLRTLNAFSSRMSAPRPVVSSGHLISPARDHCLLTSQACLRRMSPEATRNMEALELLQG